MQCLLFINLKIAFIFEAEGNMCSSCDAAAWNINPAALNSGLISDSGQHLQQKKGEAHVIAHHMESFFIFF